MEREKLKCKNLNQWKEGRCLMVKQF
uniref:Uncharacterized protein n=1 Tax=Rhizophora mucronata TaxID=61149 RepID=A0A2P2PVY2_RHIMU